MKEFDAKLLKKAALFDLTCPCWGNTRKGTLPRDAVKAMIKRNDGESDEDFEKRVTAASQQLAASKKLVVAKEFVNLAAFLASVRTTILKRYANPSFIMRGVYSIKLESIPAATEELTSLKASLRKEYVDPFLDVYEKAVLESKRILNGQFNPRDYPGAVLDADGNLKFSREVMASRFDIDWQFVSFAVPEGLPPEIREQEEKKLRDRYAEAEQKITAVLYEGFKKLVDAMVDRLTPGADGKAKTFQWTTVANFLDFIGSFKAKNTFDDQALAGMVNQAQNILNLVSMEKDPQEISKRLRDYDGLRAKTAEAFSAVKTVLDKAVTELPMRLVDFTED